MGARGANQKIGFLLISRKVSQLGYMLLHKLYINLAIAVIFTLFSSLSDLSMKICPIRRGPPWILRNENLFLAQILKNKRLKVSLVYDMYQYWLYGCFPLYFTSLWPSLTSAQKGMGWVKIIIFRWSRCRLKITWTIELDLSTDLDQR